MNRIYRLFLKHCDHRWTGVKSKIKTEDEHIITCITKCNKMYFDDIDHVMSCMNHTIRYLKDCYNIKGYTKIAEDNRDYATIKFMIVRE